MRWPTMLKRDRRGVTHLIDGTDFRWCDVNANLQPTLPDLWRPGAAPTCLWCVAEAARAQEDTCKTS